uniref:MAM domain-containing protein n=1 Tax=Setaria digitata TaxID=48799 RepID=A0A915PZX9_9BILA
MVPSASHARSYSDTVNYNAMNDDYPSVRAAPLNAQANLDVIQLASDLNCHGFNTNCRWSNTNEDELDWKVLISAPEAEPWINSLQRTHLPDASAAVLLSGDRNTWESGQLVSDLLPCIVSPLQLTATVWRSSSHRPSDQQQPNLHICSRNAHDDLSSLNCNLFPIQNGIPVTVNVPVPRDPTTPAQIVLLGDNFAGRHSGAIFVQDIVVDGDLVPDCTIKATFATLDSNKRRMQPKEPIALKNFHDTINSLVDIEELSAMQKISNVRQPYRSQFAASSAEDSLVASCLKLSCNLAEEDCDWLNDIFGWTISTGTDGFSNPLTGIMTRPAGINAYLVASYNDDSNDSIRQIISPLISIPPSVQPTYFCFFEYFALEGARFTMCTDKFFKGCFYSKTDIYKDGRHMQIHVVAENKGPNKGDIGFVPLRFTRDLAGNDPIC